MEKKEERVIKIPAIQESAQAEADLDGDDGWVDDIPGGAETGSEIGQAILGIPGYVVGGVIGAAVGAVGGFFSAIFG